MEQGNWIWAHFNPILNCLFIYVVFAGNGMMFMCNCMEFRIIFML